jgi:mannose-6-phosphate isomerase-like protein (cupin superfamily)
MSLFVWQLDESVIVREAEAEAEVVGRAPATIRLPAGSSRTGGALSTQRVTIEEGADGAKPHWHDDSAEMYFLLDGAVEILSGEDVVTA